MRPLSLTVDSTPPRWIGQKFKKHTEVIEIFINYASMSCVVSQIALKLVIVDLAQIIHLMKSLVPMKHF